MNGQQNELSAFEALRADHLSVQTRARALTDSDVRQHASASLLCVLLAALFVWLWGLTFWAGGLVALCVLRATHHAVRGWRLRREHLDAVAAVRAGMERR